MRRHGGAKGPVRVMALGARRPTPLSGPGGYQPVSRSWPSNGPILRIKWERSRVAKAASSDPNGFRIDKRKTTSPTAATARSRFVMASIRPDMLHLQPSPMAPISDSSVDKLVQNPVDNGDSLHNRTLRKRACGCTRSWGSHKGAKDAKRLWGRLTLLRARAVGRSLCYPVRWPICCPAE